MPRVERMALSFVDGMPPPILTELADEFRLQIGSGRFQKNDTGLIAAFSQVAIEPPLQLQKRAIGRRY